MNTKKLDITDSKLVAQEGICFICDDCAHKDLSLMKEHANLKTCDVVGCDNATSKSYDLTSYFKKIIKDHPERNPILKKSQIEQLIQEGTILSPGDNKLYANYDFFNRFQDVLEGVDSNREQITDRNGNSISLDLFRGNKILIAVEFWNDEDLSCCEITSEIVSKPNIEFTIDEILVIANNFVNTPCQDFVLTKNYLKATLGD